MERMETRLIRELIRSKMLNANLQQKYLKAICGVGATPDAALISEWRGQEIMAQQLLTVLEGPTS